MGSAAGQSGPERFIPLNAFGDDPTPGSVRMICGASALSSIFWRNWPIIIARIVANIGDENARLRSRLPRMERSAPCLSGDVSDNPYH